MWFYLLALVAVALAKPHGGHRGGHFPCGLPPYADELPEDLQTKVKAIWKDYKEGDKCYEQQGLTRELLDELPKEKRIELFKNAHLPFIKKLPKDIQDQFKAIWKDRSIPRDQKPEKLKELAQKILKGDQLEQFNKFHEKKEKERQEFKTKIGKLSDEAKGAWDKLEKLSDQKWDILNGLSDNARDEIFELFKGRFGHHFGPQR